MGLLDKIDDARGARRKDWAGEPPFWELDAARYGLYGSTTPTRERIENDYESYVAGAYKGNGVVFAAIDRRQQVFSQASFAWRRKVNGRPGDLFGSPELGLLESPWPNGTTGELLAHMEQDASLAGQFYATTVDDAGRIGRNATGAGRRIARMRPDWVTLVIDAPSGNPYNVDARVVAFLYEPRVSGGGYSDPLLLLPSEVCHYSPTPDPVARFRGMSWLTPVIKEIMADNAATKHKLKYFENGATPGMVVSGIPAVSKKQFDDLVDMMEARHRGAGNAYKTLYLTAGADAKALGSDLRQLDFKVTQGAGETRLATAAGIPASILGISEGLQGSSLNAGNFGAARRLFVDSTMRDLWSKAAPSLQTLVTPPARASLWYDARDIPFLREDAKDDAEIRAQDALALRTLLDAGYEPDAAIQYLITGDLKVLTGRHSGLFSVQLQAPGQEMPTLPAASNERVDDA